MKKKTIIYSLILILLITVIFILVGLIKQYEKSGNANVLVIPDDQGLGQQAEALEENQKTSVINFNLIPYPSNYNFAQTYNDCGPFNTAAVVRALTGENVSSADFAKTITHRIKYKWTLPEGLTEQLNLYGVTTETPDLSELSEYEKASYLREQIALQHPVILLIKKENFQHYITLFGFDTAKDEFYIYDSLMARDKDGLTKDENGDLPGNKTITTDKLLKSWSGGGMLGKYTWFAIVSSYK